MLNNCILPIRRDIYVSCTSPSSFISFHNYDFSFIVYIKENLFFEMLNPQKMVL